MPQRRSLMTLLAAFAFVCLFATGTFAQDSRPESKPPVDKAPVAKPQEAPPPAATKPAAEEAYAFVKMETTLGDMILQLDRKKAPITVENFLTYVEAKHYDGSIFHRVIPNFMIQGGGFSQEYEKLQTRAPIKNEWRNGLKNVRGSIAMARLGRQPDSATNQFFINVKNNTSLDQPNDGAAYAVFGQVIAGMMVMDMIRTTPTRRGVSVKNNPRQRLSDVPMKMVVIKTITKITQEEASKIVKAEMDGTTPTSQPTD